MQFMIIRKADDKTEAGVMPGQDLLDAMASYNERLANAGALVGGTGLKPSRDGFRVKFSNGKPAVTDGPFAETKELIAGYTMISVGSRQEAEALVKQWPPEDGDVELEVRALYEIEDFEPGAGVDHTTRVFGRLARQPSLMCTYLNFDGNCREAFEFYAKVLGGEIVTMMTAADAGMTDVSGIIHARLQAGKFVLMGSDSFAGNHVPPAGMSVQASIDDLEQAEKTFNELAEGGEVTMAWSETFFARGFGMVVDRFGTRWMINCDIPMQG